MVVGVIGDSTLLNRRGIKCCLPFLNIKSVSKFGHVPSLEFDHVCTVQILFTAFGLYHTCILYSQEEAFHHTQPV